MQAALDSCLEGTRTQVLKTIVDWINDLDVNAPRIFWLQGRVKSAIALWVKHVGGLGSCFYLPMSCNNGRMEPLSNVLAGMAAKHCGDRRVGREWLQLIAKAHPVAAQVDEGSSSPFSFLHTHHLTPIIRHHSCSGQYPTREFLLSSLSMVFLVCVRGTLSPEGISGREIKHITIDYGKMHNEKLAPSSWRKCKKYGGTNFSLCILP